MPSRFALTIALTKSECSLAYLLGLFLTLKELQRHEQQYNRPTSRRTLKLLIMG